MFLIFLNLINASDSEDIVVSSLKAPFTSPSFLKTTGFNKLFVAISLIIAVLYLSWTNKNQKKNQVAFSSGLGIMIMAYHFFLGMIFPNSLFMCALIFCSIVVLLALMTRYTKFSPICVAIANGYYGGFLSITIFYVSNSGYGLFLMVICGFLSYILDISIPFFSAKFSKIISCSFLTLSFIDLFLGIFDKAMLIIEKSAIYKYPAKGIILLVITIFTFKDVFIAATNDVLSSKTENESV